MRQHLVILGSTLVALALVGTSCSQQPAAPGQPVEKVQENSAQVEQQIPKTTTTAPAKPKTVSVPVSNSYTQALNIYRASGAYLQFVNCSATPGYLSLKKGVKFMADNRDNKPRTIAIGKVKSFRIPAYGYTIFTAPGAGTYYVTCDGGGSAQLNVEG